MRELLLAYLFGQLDWHEREQVERALAEEPQMQEEFRRLQECLLGEEHGDVLSSEPPADLAKRTCERIARLVQGDGAGQSEMPGLRGTSSHARRPAAFSDAALSSPAARNRCSIGELAATIGVTVVMAMIILPAIHDSRVMARRDGCQDHLRQIAQGIRAFADANAGAIPWVPDVGKDAFAGIFSVRLADGYYVDRQLLGELLVCPATIRVGEWQQDGYLLRLFVPTHEQVMAASGVSLASMRRRLAGSYAYRFGYVNDFGRYCEWRLDRSPHSAILSDAPSLSQAGFQSANHGGCGQNVAFADGHVAFVRECRSAAGGDHLFLNNDGLRAAPRGEKDSVLGRSDDGPRVELLRLQRLVP